MDEAKKAVVDDIEKTEREKFATVLRRLRGKRGQMEVAIGAKVGYRTYTTWENQERLPSSRSLGKLAAYFKVSKADLLQ